MTSAVDYAVDLDVFQGPMDLLLYLIRKDEIDIYDIPIARITEQYLKYVEMLKLLNLENAGEYILMAATLIRIKSQMLLPRSADSDEEFDPREELTRALLEYSKFKEAGEILKEKRTFEARLVSVQGRGNGYRSTEAVLSDATSIFDLLTAFHEVLRNFTDEISYQVNAQEITVEDRTRVIINILSQRDWATFEDLFADVNTKLVAIVTFMAILDLVKMQRLIIRQTDAFTEIRVYPTEILDRDPVTEESILTPEALPQAG